MAKGRAFRIYNPSQDIPLTAANGYRVLQGAKGLGLPSYRTSYSALPLGGSTAQTVPGPRRITLPLEVAATTRQEFLKRCQALSAVLSDGARLQIVDAGFDVTVDVIYGGGLEGDESDGRAGESGDSTRSMYQPGQEGEVWQRADLLLDCPSGSLPLTQAVFSSVTSASLPTDHVRNLITNPSFEKDLNGWTPYSTGTIDWNGTFSKFGSRSLQAAFDNTASNTSTLYGAYTTVSGLAVGVPYTASAFVRDPYGSNQVALFITDHYGTRNQSFGDFERVTNVFTPTATSHTLWALNTVNAKSIDTFQLDGVMVNQGTTPATYVDGDQPGCVWEGAPHASTSRFDGLPAPIATVDNSAMPAADLIWMLTGPATSAAFICRASNQTTTLTYNLGIDQRLLIDTQARSAQLLTPADGAFADVVARSATKRASGASLVGALSGDVFWQLPDAADPEVSVSMTGYTANTRVDLAVIRNVRALA